MQKIINTNHPSPNFDERASGERIQHLVLHYTAGDFDQSLKWLTMQDTPNRVSAHYLVCEDGRIYNLVDESKRAWHAGVSYWDGVDGINATSIGIEIVNPGHGAHYRDFPHKQMTAVAELSKDIVHRHQISPFGVLGHSDIAPGRKVDPGEKFDWHFLAKHGVGIMPPEHLTSVHADPTHLRAQFSEFGYNPKVDLDTLISCFQLHYGRDIPAQLNWLLQQKHHHLSRKKAL